MKRQGNYQGPGIYRHYKGGHYRVIGVARPEAGGPMVVIYHSYSVEHDLDRWMQGADFVSRPLDSAPGVDAFNDMHDGGMFPVPRFEKVSS